MGMFNNLMSKIFGHAGAATSTTQAPPSTTIESATAPSATTPAASPVSPATAAPAATPDPAAAPAQTVDVTAILDGLAAKNSEKLDWKKSIVDLLKLLDMDSSISARKQLATELHYSGDQNDSATMNVWLHKQVLRQLSEHGGKIPRDPL
jgi:3-oxoacyl-ACP reductase-like protein